MRLSTQCRLRYIEPLSKAERSDYLEDDLRLGSLAIVMGCDYSLSARLLKW
jgi:hypothetical protein